MPNHSEIDDLDAIIDSDIEDNGDSSDDDIKPPPPTEEASDSDEVNSLISNDDDDDMNSLIDIDDEIHNSAKEVGVNNNESSFFHATTDSDGNTDDDSDDNDDDDDENYLQKIDSDIKTNIISEYHPELKVHNNEEVETLSRVIRNERGVIIDLLHKTVPILTKYERARILGERAKQLNMGAKPVVSISDNVIDGYLIALEEFNHKKIPFVIKRPLPNGGCEYWKLQDLEIL
jgi:DNA-directed RNA polymerase I, II, and III subunit RPABC2